MKQNFFKSMFTDESGDISSKRVLGTLLILCIAFNFIYSAFKPTEVNESLLTAVKELALILVLATTGDKAFKYISSMRKAQKPKEDGSDTER